MANNFRLTRKGSIILGLLGFFLLAGGLAFAVWYLNRPDSQVAPGDSDASGCAICNPPDALQCISGQEEKCQLNEEFNKICWTYTGVACDPNDPKYDGGGGGGTGQQCDQCTPGECSEAGCSAQCPAGTDPRSDECKKDGKVGFNTFACRGQHAACNECIGDPECSGKGVPYPELGYVAKCNTPGHYDDGNPVGSAPDCAMSNNSGQLPNVSDPNSWCKTYQLDVHTPNGTDAIVVWVGDGGDTCNSDMGNADACRANLDWNCGEEPPPTPECNITVSPVCKINGNDASVDVTWNVTGENFEFGPSSDLGSVVIRIDDTRDPWFTEGKDTFWSTHYNAFITSGLNPKSATWNFDNKIDSGVNYTVSASAYTKTYVNDAETPAVCTTGLVNFSCDTEVLQCNQSGCTTDSDCGGGLICTDAGICRNPACENQPDCVCPTIEESECNESCTTSDDCKGALECFDGLCRAAQCSGEADCICPTGEPLWTINKEGVPTCTQAKSSTAMINYTIIVRNSGDMEGTLKSVVDVIDSGMDVSWISEASISAGGKLTSTGIIWEFAERGSGAFEPGEELILTYTVNVPQSGFGTYTNVVTGNPTEGAPFSDDATVQVSCVIPTTAIFDSTGSKIAAAAVLIVVSGALMYYNSADRKMAEGLAELTPEARYDRKVAGRREEFENNLLGEESEE